MEKLFPTQEIGSLKKPGWLVKLLKDRLISGEEKERARDDAAYINLRLLEESGLDLVYDGEARRVEMYEYPIRRIDGFQFCGRVRAFDNRYYRKARCIDRVRYKAPYHLEEFLFVKRHAKKPIKVPVTGAYTLAEWSYNEFYRTKEEFVLDLASGVIRPLLRDLASHGAAILQIDEPAATTHPNEVALFVESFNESVKGLGAKVGIHICYSYNYGTLFPQILEAKASQIALEFANRETMDHGVSREEAYSPLRLFSEHRASIPIGLGVVDVHSNTIETPTLIAERVLHAVRVLGDPKMLLINPDCGLRTRDRAVAFTKLRNMVEGAALAGKKVS